MNNQWIKTADRAPTEQDLPVWITEEGRKLPLLFGYIPNNCSAHGTHWRPAKADIPEPPVGETQSDKDCAEYIKRYGAETPWIKDLRCYTSDIWHAACAYTRRDEREQVAKMLPVPLPQSTQTMREVFDAIEAIRARCGGGRK